MLLNWIPDALMSRRRITRCRSLIARVKRTLAALEDRLVLDASIILPASITVNAGGVTTSVLTITDANEDLLCGSLVIAEGFVVDDGGDALSLKNQGAAASELGGEGNPISIGGTVVGTSSDGTGDTPLVVGFYAAAIATDVQTLLQDVTFTTMKTSGMALANEETGTGSDPILTFANEVCTGSALVARATLFDSAVASVSNDTFSGIGSAIVTVSGGTNTESLTSRQAGAAQTAAAPLNSMSLADGTDVRRIKRLAPSVAKSRGGRSSNKLPATGSWRTRCVA